MEGSKATFKADQPPGSFASIRKTELAFEKLSVNPLREKPEGRQTWLVQQLKEIIRDLVSLTVFSVFI